MVDRPMTPPLGMSPEHQSIMQRQIRQVLAQQSHFEDEAEVALQRLGGDATYQVRKELRGRLGDRAVSPARQTDDGPSSPASGLRAQTEPYLKESRVAQLVAPGGFRRNYLTENTEPKELLYSCFLDHLEHFAGMYDEVDGEGIPLLDRRHDGTSLVRTFLITLKGFVGPAILYLASAWAAGGFFFSIAGMCFCVIWNYATVMLLFAAYQRLKGSFGEMGRIVGGVWLARLVNLSLVLQQCSVCCTYFIFVGQSLIHAANSLTNCKYDSWLSSSGAFYLVCAAQLLAYIPLTFIRKLKHLTAPAILADIILAISVSYILYYCISLLAERGPHPDVAWGFGKSPSVYLGIAIFTFEGIGLILPIASSMREPEYFPHMFGAVTLVLLVITMGLGSLGYLVFGPDTSVDMLLDLSKYSPHASMPITLLIIYPIAVVCGYPIQFLPAANILEQKFGCKNNILKSCLLRAGLSVVLMVVALIGGDSFDHFLSICSAVACIPLALVYPPLLHYHACAGSKWMKLVDGILVIMGLCAVVYVLVPSVVQWLNKPPTIHEACIPSRYEY